ncbi:hypothetical protein LJB96_02180 [Methanobrevibacter sp. OttesenSCG-928-K11]|nr:hypothetical protein [Methanobrevibacter sp. OttesenSCG-928-K11]
MNKLKIGILAIVIVLAVVFVSGCIGEDTTIEDKTYSGHGISFSYPGIYNLSEVNDDGTNKIYLSTSDNNASSSIFIENDTIGISNDVAFERIDAAKDDLGINTLEKKEINGVQGLFMKYNEGEVGHKYTWAFQFVKDGINYHFMIGSDDEQTVKETTDKILQTIKSN